MDIATGLITHRASFRVLARRKVIGLATLGMGVVGLVGTIHGAGRYLKVEYPASVATNELQVAVTYTLWIPEGTPRLRGIIVHQHGAGVPASTAGANAAYDLHWQALARKWDCALLGPSYHVQTDLNPGASKLWSDPRRGSEKTFLTALSELAVKSGQPEVATVPWALWGHSGGGIWSEVMTTLHPDRVAVVWLRSGSAAMVRHKPDIPQPVVPAAACAVPTMCNPGVKEKSRPPWSGTLATFKEYPAQGAPIGFAPDPRTGHEWWWQPLPGHSIFRRLPGDALAGQGQPRANPQAGGHEPRVAGIATG